jgi:hypothetical protein
VRGTASIALALVLAAGGVRAEEPAPSETRWYGWQIILADAAGVALICAGAKNNTGELIAAGTITIAAVPPVIHFAHHAPGDDSSASSSGRYRSAPASRCSGCCTRTAGKVAASC